MNTAIEIMATPTPAGFALMMLLIVAPTFLTFVGIVFGTRWIMDRISARRSAVADPYDDWL